MIRGVAGMLNGNFFQMTVFPSSTLAGYLTTLDAAKSEIEWARLVTFTFSNNWEVGAAADDAKPDGLIIRYMKDAVYTWALTIALFGFTDVNGTWHPSKGYVLLPYNSETGTPSLQQQVNVDGSTYYYVEGATAGIGAVVAVDDPSGYVAVLMEG